MILTNEEIIKRFEFDLKIGRFKHPDSLNKGYAFKASKCEISNAIFRTILEAIGYELHFDEPNLYGGFKSTIIYVNMDKKTYSVYDTFTSNVLELNEIPYYILKEERDD